MTDLMADFGNNKEEAFHQISLLKEAGYLQIFSSNGSLIPAVEEAMNPEFFRNNPEVKMKIKPTWEGFNLIDTIRDENVWSKAKKIYTQMTCNIADNNCEQKLPFKTMISLCDLIIRKQLKYAIDHD
jgi:hypothetical protein